MNHENHPTDSEIFLCAGPRTPFAKMDGPMAYLDEYFKYIDASHFPAITNEDVLVNKP